MPKWRMLTGQWNATAISLLLLIDDAPVFRAAFSGTLTIHVPELEVFGVEMGAGRPSLHRRRCSIWSSAI
jgi:hypothetical protein